MGVHRSRIEHLKRKLGDGDWVMAEDLASELSVSRRTIRRYMRELEDIDGAAIERSRQGYRLAGAPSSSFARGPGDLVAFCAMSLSLKPFSNTVFGSQLQELARRMRNDLSETLRASSGDAGDYLRFLAPPPAGAALRHVDRLLDCAMRRIAISVDYQNGSTSEDMNAKLEPHAVVSRADGWFLIAKGMRGFRALAVSKILSVRCLDVSFQRDPSFDLERIS